jgi:hypothetical protein
MNGAVIAMNRKHNKNRVNVRFRFLAADLELSRLFRMFIINKKLNIVMARNGIKLT